MKRGRHSCVKRGERLDGTPCPKRSSGFTASFPSPFDGGCENRLSAASSSCRSLRLPLGSGACAATNLMVAMLPALMFGPRRAVTFSAQRTKVIRPLSFRQPLPHICAPLRETSHCSKEPPSYPIGWSRTEGSFRTGPRFRLSWDDSSIEIDAREKPSGTGMGQHASDRPSCARRFSSDFELARQQVIHAFFVYNQHNQVDRLSSELQPPASSGNANRRRCAPPVAIAIRSSAGRDSFSGNRSVCEAQLRPYIGWFPPVRRPI
jgi:hypothetical protein